MEGYRVSLIRAAADFDTYHCMKAFAEHPDVCNRMAFDWLVARCEQAVLWELSARMPRAYTDDGLLKLRLGARMPQGKPEVKPDVSISDLAAKSDEERQTFYMKCMESAGIAVDKDGRSVPRS